MNNKTYLHHLKETIKITEASVMDKFDEIRWKADTLKEKDLGLKTNKPERHIVGLEGFFFVLSAAISGKDDINLWKATDLSNDYPKNGKQIYKANKKVVEDYIKLREKQVKPFLPQLIKAIKELVKGNEGADERTKALEKLSKDRKALSDDLIGVEYMRGNGKAYSYIRGDFISSQQILE